MRGQAFVVCADEDQAEQGIKEMRGHMFFGKPLRLNFTRVQSDTVSKGRGIFDEGLKLQRENLQKIELKNK